MSTARKAIKQVEKELLARKRELEQELDKLAKEKFDDGQIQDPGDQALSSTMELLKTSLQDAEFAEYQRIELALQKVQDGTYGVCIDCGEEIAEKRLKSYPNAARCLLCQEAFEDQG